MKRTATDLRAHLVLDAIAQVRNEMATKSELAKLEAKVDAHRAETARGFAELDRELTRHAEVHREIEKDIEVLKRRPPRTAARPTRRR
jgi:hypothetical protein